MQLSPEQFIVKHQVFSRHDLKGLLLSRNGSANQNTLNAHLERWKKQKKIIQVKRGLYISAVSGKDNLVDPFILANKMTSDSVIAYHGALELHGYAQSHFNEITYLSASSPKDLDFNGITYKALKPRPALRKNKFENNWIEVIDKNGVEIRVTSLERTLVDVLDRTEIAGGIEEVIRSINSIDALRLKDLESYLIALERSTTVSRVGFFLEQNKERLLVSEKLLNRLEGLIPKSKVYFRRKEKGESKFLSRWNLVVPKKYVEKNWEGVN